MNAMLTLIIIYRLMCVGLGLLFAYLFAEAGHSGWAVASMAIGFLASMMSSYSSNEG